MASRRRAAALAIFLLGPVQVASAQEGFEAVQEQCVACHGTGVSLTDEVPSLGGIDAYYALLQLVAFRSGNRPGDAMQALTTDLTDNDLRAAAAWIAGLPPPQVPDTPPPPDAEAAALAQEHRCNSCHGADYRGGKQIPPLKNQREDYLRKALLDFKAERRLGSRAAMVEIAQALSEAEIDLLARYLATLP
ncbi:c-type cytochrome [Yangia mangrovi]|nr:c-type cytochrome [Alloyangia mangrovi]MCT4373044.1 c-type cytochrome [Alloyangia mangrovi]